MKLVCLDLESFYSDTYSLSKITTEEYCRHPDFYCQMVGVQIDGEAKATVYPGHELKYNQALRDLITNNAVIAHTAACDMFIFNNTFSLRPKAIVDTLSMARMLYPHEKRHSLKFLSEKFGLPEKMSQRLVDVKGTRILSPSQFESLAEYCAGDVENTMALAKLMLPLMPAEELRLIDITVRCASEPMALLDAPLLEKTWKDEIARKATQLERIHEKTGATVDDLQSSAKFAELLKAQGVEPPMKASPSDPTKQIFAFAKSDDALKELLEDNAENIVGDMIEARLGAKSTITETRAKRLLDISHRGAMPFGLDYYGAFTGRWSGGAGMKNNVQNFPRGSNLRKSIVAPKGYVIGVCDASQIEARCLVHEAGQWDVVEAFATGRDLYSELASKFYGMTVTKADKERRGLGKLLILSSGYGAGASSIQATAKRGIYGPSILLSDAEALAARDLYRNNNPYVVAMWKQGEKVIRDLFEGRSDYQWGNSFRVKGGRVYMPNGSFIDYSTLRPADTPGENWTMGTKKGPRFTYGAKMVQGCIQGIARLIVAQAAVRVAQAGIKILSLTHDEIIALYPEAEADRHQEFVLQEMKRAPSWCDARLGLDAEADYATNYSK